ncbi:DNA repair helicase RAD25 [Nitrospirillum amazonense]|uniref:DNA repair helicase RAD25 n=1 Tax=Nitrospirillum amazonense TaxID=28077 RepID=A0A560JFN3_9PROT|nr:DEAD/DEAH box helicase [Nitrospirillum amazonense]TWB69787.1 DNA repair helicase RAD25 [Nitrospirillum amazonense]
MTGWELKVRPRDWQNVALERWRPNRRGVVQVVTGGGKTVFAQLCLLEFFKDETLGQALIIVPTVSLLDQWCIALQDEMNVRPDQIGLLSGQEKPKGDEPIIVAVINTARKFTATFAKGRRIFLIVDECHRAGSPSNAKALDGDFAATLGLSATPEREYDEGFTELIAPKIGPIIYHYTYRDAAAEGIITPFSLINIHVDLLSDEEERYSKLSRSIARCIRKGGVAEGQEERLKRLLQQRAAVSANATMRIPVAIKLVEQHRGDRAVIFHERIDAANTIVNILKARGHRATVYHAEIGPIVRRDNLRLFRRGLFDVLVCCRALDEGINVPEASVAIIASSTASQRQRIQRLGRILRRAKGKTEASVYTIFATEEERKRLAQEATSLEGTTTIEWQQGKMQAHA